MNLKTLRNNAGLSQQQMADFLQVSKPTYNHYESGRYEPSLATLTKIADFFNVSTDYLLGHQTEAPTANCTPLQKKLIHHILELDDDLCEIAEPTIEGLYVTNQERKLLRQKVAKISNEGDVQNGI